MIQKFAYCVEKSYINGLEKMWISQNNPEILYPYKNFEWES